ncbi:N-acetyltransferase [uncultured Psychrosphaera sp.]|uniref:GNAT family N-acetyltransferase n=1 Tax=uncultured Psychrosphaera sp. TaxID=1403522 RepID=UPI0026138BB7|nr:N-acetyltransferase [uncultured Psychrosphaera sp.]
MIKRLGNVNESVARQIFSVFQRSYKIEADLIGVTDFPPLSRTVEDIMCSNTQFYGAVVNPCMVNDSTVNTSTENKCIGGVIEISIKNKTLDICSLTVDPNHFRKGIAGKLISFVLKESDFADAVVETAVVNKPAINLYEKHGFIEFKRFTPSHGIEKLAMFLRR